MQILKDLASIAGTISGVIFGIANLVVFSKVTKLRNDYKFTVRLAEHISFFASAQSEWNQFLTSRKIDEKSIIESIAKIKPRLATMSGVAPAGIKNACKALESSIAKKSLLDWFSPEPICIDKTFVRNGYNRIVELHEHLKEHQTEKQNRPIL